MGDQNGKTCECPSKPIETLTNQSTGKTFSIKKAFKMVRSGLIEALIMIKGFLTHYEFSYRKPTKKIVEDYLKFSTELIESFMKIAPTIISDIIDSPELLKLIVSVNRSSNQLVSQITGSTKIRFAMRLQELLSAYTDRSPKQEETTVITPEMYYNRAMEMELQDQVPAGFAAFVKKYYEETYKKELTAAEDEARVIHENWIRFVNTYGSNSKWKFDLTEEDETKFKEDSRRLGTEAAKFRLLEPRIATLNVNVD